MSVLCGPQFTGLRQHRSGHLLMLQGMWPFRREIGISGESPGPGITAVDLEGKRSWCQYVDAHATCCVVSNTVLCF